MNTALPSAVTEPTEPEASMDRLGDILDRSGFSGAIEQWKQAACRAATLKFEAKRTYCEAYLASDGRNETARTAEADLVSRNAALEAERARIEAKAAEFLVEYALTGARAYAGP